MKFLEATIFGLTAWRLCLSGALVIVFFVLRSRWSHKVATEAIEFSASASTAHSVNESLKSRGEGKGKLSLARAKRASPVNLTDTQRIDHLHRSVALRAGETADLKDLSFGRLAQLSVKFVGVEHASGKEYARIVLDLGGPSADGGSGVEPVGNNEFLMPRGAYGDPNSSIHHTCTRGDAVSQLEVRVSRLDLDKRTVTVDVMHVRGGQRAA
jgi:hypothetical protein